MKVSSLFTSIILLLCGCAFAAPEDGVSGGGVQFERYDGPPLPDPENFDRAGVKATAPVLTTAWFSAYSAGLNPRITFPGACPNEPYPELAISRPFAA